MKMHRQPMIRHNYAVAECTAIVVAQVDNEFPVHLVLQINGKTQRVCMTVAEARAISSALAHTAADVASGTL